MTPKEIRQKANDIMRQFDESPKAFCNSPIAPFMQDRISLNIKERELVDGVRKAEAEMVRLSQEIMKIKGALAYVDEKIVTFFDEKPSSEGA
jgi:hypothetical protein